MSFYSNSNGKGGPQAEGWEHQGPVLAGMGSLPPAAGLAGPRAPVSLLFRAQRSPDCWPLSVWQWKGEAEKPSGQSHLCTSPTHPRHLRSLSAAAETAVRVGPLTPETPECSRRAKPPLEASPAPRSVMPWHVTRCSLLWVWWRPRGGEGPEDGGLRRLKGRQWPGRQDKGREGGGAGREAQARPCGSPGRGAGPLPRGSLLGHKGQQSGGRA